MLANGGLYVTYFGIAGACNGISGTDVPFLEGHSAECARDYPFVRGALRSICANEAT